MDEAEEKRISEEYNRRRSQEAAPAPVASAPPPKKKWYEFGSSSDSINKQKAMADAVRAESDKPAAGALRKKVDEATQ